MMTNRCPLNFCLTCRHFAESKSGNCTCTIYNEPIRWYQYGCVDYREKDVVPMDWKDETEGRADDNLE